MKKLLFIGLCLMAVASCRQEAPKVDTEAVRQRDSLNQVITERDNEINDMLATFNEIEEGFREINEAQNRVSVAKQGEGGHEETAHTRECTVHTVDNASEP